ncbi:MAG: chromosome partitioning protein ParA [Phycisphaerae bacterium]|nr:chromosome partitioning protein ParA [Phycisphaerae bacterium]
MVSDAGRRGPRIIAVINQKGGVGKTTSAVNLGAALSEAGQRVLMIDLDPQAHMSLHLGVDAANVEQSVYDILVDENCLVNDAVVRVDDNLDAIPAETDLAAAESELASTADRNSILRTRLADLLSRYDVVLIDCPPSLGLLTLNALTMATEVFVPMQAHFLALQGVGKLLETIGMVCGSVNPELQVTGIILCMHERQTMLAKEVVSDLESFIESSRDQDVPWRSCRVLQPPIRRNIKLAEAPSFGQTIFQYEPTCHGANDYRALASDVLAAWNPEITAEVDCIVETPPTTSETVNDDPPLDVNNDHAKVAGSDRDHVESS